MSGRSCGEPIVGEVLASEIGAAAWEFVVGVNPRACGSKAELDDDCDLAACLRLGGGDPIW